ncbi:MAG: carboxypeptidase-like regulatory domain-containing protein [Lewinellaceae bacterium]|nr:carboxypeptidase-like regulatory domain-containing protein [Lewinellaceae bacterium]
MRISILFSLFCLFATAGFTQKPLQGIVTDPQGTPLAFVTVLLNNEPGKGVLTDIEGRFSIGADVAVRRLGFRYVGYETRVVEAEFWQKTSEKLLVIVLKPTELALPEAVVRAGENPADILIRKAIANRRRNNPDLHKSYTCTTYNKVLFDMVPNRAIFEQEYAGKDTSRESVRDAWTRFDKMERNTRDRHVFLMESVTERSFLFPDMVQENVLLNRVAGFQNAGIVALSNMVQPFSFYGDHLTILDKNFVNPISPGSPNLYFFHIEDTLYTGPDTVWVISFHPRKGKVFEALEGVLHLHSRGWATQNVRAQPANPGNLHLKIEQAYQMVDGGLGRADTVQWFPAQLNFELEIKKYPAPFVGMRGSGRSYITDVRLGAPVRLRDMNPEMPVILLPEANSRSDSAWMRWRGLAPLNDKESRTYVWLDSIGKSEKFDNTADLTGFLTTGRLPIGGSFVSLDLRNLLKFNEYEGTRLGLGLSTGQARPLLPHRRLEVGANLGYGFRDKGWKYGGYALWRIMRSRQTQLRISWRRDLLEPGAPYEISAPALFDRSLYARRMDRTDEFAASVGSRLGRFFSAEGIFRKQELRPGYAYRYGTDDSGFADQFRFTEATLFLRFAHGERPRTFLANDIGSTQRLPVVELAYTRGWRGLWQGEYNYERWTAAVYHAFFLGRLGRSRWRVEAGIASADAPLAKLYTLNQTGRRDGWGLNLFVLPNTFQSLPDTAFLADRFVNFYFAQEIGPVFTAPNTRRPT